LESAGLNRASIYMPAIVLPQLIVKTNTVAQQLTKLITPAQIHFKIH